MSYLVRVNRVRFAGATKDSRYTVGAESSAVGRNLRVACARAMAHLVGQWKDADLVKEFDLRVTVENVSEFSHAVALRAAAAEKSARLMDAKGDHAAAAELRKTIPPRKP